MSLKGQIAVETHRAHPGATPKSFSLGYPAPRNGGIFLNRTAPAPHIRPRAGCKTGHRVCGSPWGWSVPQSILQLI